MNYSVNVKNLLYLMHKKKLIGVTNNLIVSVKAIKVCTFKNINIIHVFSCSTQILHVRKGNI